MIGTQEVRSEYKQSGLTVAISSAVMDVAMAVQSSLARSEEVKDERLNALLKVKAANEAIETAEKAKSVIEALKNTGNIREAIASSEIKLSATLGKNQSTATSQSQQISQQGSELSASKVVIRATEGDNTLIGSKINATETEVEGNNVNLLASTDSQSQRTNNQNSGWGVGVLAGSTGIGIEGRANLGKGYSNSDTQQQNQTEINSDSLKIKATETTTLKGAVANIDHLQLDTQNLRIESVQDRENDESTEKQGGGKALFSYGGMGSSLSAQGSQNNAKVDYAQVKEQSGFNIGKSSHISVTENTHLKGGVINAEGDQANHQMQTGTLTTENIENRSEIKVSSLSGGISTDMSQLATSAIGVALSGLGNLNESDRSQTQSAISSNIDLQITDNEAQKQKTGKTAEETLQSLNRDTVNANQKLEKPDLTKVQERQETAQVIGDLSQSGINRLVGEHLKEANQKRAEAESIAQTDQAKAEILRNEAKVIEAEYGVGSSLQMGIRAATGALQGLATGNTNQAIVGGLSPYANKAIKEATTNADGSINKETNLIAHAVLGAVEAKATGNNALAGATAGAVGEGTAMLLTQGKSVNDLTENEKQNVVALSQLASGIAGGIVGDSTSNAVAGAEIGKTAVENNFLSQAEYAELDYFMKKKILTQEDAIRVQYLLEKDKVSNKLLHTWQTQPEKLDKKDKNTLFKWVDEYGNIPQQIQLLNTPTNSSQIKPDYSDLKFRAQKVYNYSGSFEGKSSESLSNGLLLLNSGGVARTTASVITKLEKASVNINSKVQPILNNAKNLVEKYPNATGAIADGGVALGTHVGYKVSTGQDVNPYEAIGAFSGGVLTRNQSLGNQIRINVGVATVTSLSKEPNGKDLGNAYFGAITSPIVNVPFTKFGSAGNALGGYASEYIGDLENRNKEIKNILDKINSFQGGNNEK